MNQGDIERMYGFKIRRAVRQARGKILIEIKIIQRNRIGPMAALYEGLGDFARRGGFTGSAWPCEQDNGSRTRRHGLLRHPADDIAITLLRRMNKLLRLPGCKGINGFIVIIEPRHKLPPA